MIMVDQTTIADLTAELQRSITGEVRFDRYSRMLYSTDASPYQIRPLGIVIPRQVEDVQAAVTLAAKYRLPILPRGGGTSLNGQSIGPALIIDFSKYLNGLVEVDLEARTAKVQAGLTVGLLNVLLQRHGLMLGTDPASAERATIGGCIGNNASGSHSILYGMMADNVQSLRVLLADGSAAEFAPLDLAAVAAKGRQDTLEGAIYRQIPAIIGGVKEEIITHWPRHWRRSSGYSLERLAPPLLSVEERARLYAGHRFHPFSFNSHSPDHLNLAQLITGSEGTLGIVTEATVRLVPRPPYTALAIVHFSTVLEACSTIPAILECEPSASELLDRNLMQLARSQPAWVRKMGFVEGDPGAVLVTEFFGRSVAELQQKLAHFIAHLLQRNWNNPVVTILDPAQQRDVWAVRKAGLNLLMSQRSPYKPAPGIEDVSIPPERLADYMARIFAICQAESDIPGVVVYAHASAGCLHVRPLLNLHTPRGVELMAELTERACDLALEFGGVLSGEHGDGITRSSLNPRLFGPALYGAMQAVKQSFDPENLLNPGKVVDGDGDGLPPTENLRYGGAYRPVQLQSLTFDWTADGSYLDAIEMCNGAGVCRKLESGTMCPSYMATRDERDTTRGRANALRNALTNGLPQEELYSKDMYGVLDLCLGCKACKSECPSSVDMAQIKAEFLVHYYRRNGLPFFNRLMGLLPTFNTWLFRVKPLIPLVNRSLKARPIKRLLAQIGIHPNRTLPQYASRSFSDWFAKESKPNPRSSAFVRVPPSEKPPVLLFHDTWTNYNEPHIGRALVQVLRAAGYEPFLATGRKCCGRPLITGGQADKARSWVDDNVALLLPYAQQGIPIVGAEPSCMLTLRDEYVTLASEPQAAHEVAKQVFTFEEFVVREAGQGRFRPSWRPTAGKALLHGHCHQKALVGNGPSIKALELAGYEVEVIPSGCCGMAGDFGYQAEHYTISQTIAEDRLLPAVRAAAMETLLVASGTSCRHQIDHFSGRQSLHLAEALALVLK